MNSVFAEGLIGKSHNKMSSNMGSSTTILCSSIDKSEPNEVMAVSNSGLMYEFVESKSVPELLLSFFIIHWFSLPVQFNWFPN